MKRTFDGLEQPVMLYDMSLYCRCQGHLFNTVHHFKSNVEHHTSKCGGLVRGETLDIKFLLFPVAKRLSSLQEKQESDYRA